MGLMIGFAVLFTSVDPAAGFTPCSSLPLQRAPGPHHARAACLMQTLQPNAEAARLAKLKVPQLREELGNLGLVKGGNKTVLIQRLLAQPVEQTLHFQMLDDVGEVEDISVELSTQDDFEKFVGHAALFSASKTTRKRVSRIMTLSKALEVAADPTVYLHMGRQIGF